MVLKVNKVGATLTNWGIEPLILPKTNGLTIGLAKMAKTLLAGKPTYYTHYMRTDSKLNQVTTIAKRKLLPFYVYFLLSFS